MNTFDVKAFRIQQRRRYGMDFSTLKQSPRLCTLTWRGGFTIVVEDLGPS